MESIFAYSLVITIGIAIASIAEYWQGRENTENNA